MSRILTIREALHEAAAYLGRRGIASARLDAEVLLAFTLARDRLALYLNMDKPLSASEKSEYRDVLRRRAKHEPTAYITGNKEFWSMQFKVDRSVMIPRPETETLVERAIEKTVRLAGQFPEEMTLFDIGTGSGAVAISLAAELRRRLAPPQCPRVTIIASDISERALEVAQNNASRLVPDAAIRFVRGSLFAGSTEVLDLVVSNPPYVALAEKSSLAPEITAWEPPEAVFAGDDALGCIREIVAESPEHLRTGGYLLVEIGMGQRREVEEILLSSGAFCNIEFFRDYGGAERVVSAERK